MSGPFAMGNGSCLLSLKLHSFLRRTASLRPPALRILLCFRSYRPAWTTPTWGTQFAKVTSFFMYRLRHPYNPTAFGFVHTVERLRSTLAHSSNCRSWTDCVRSILSNRKSKASLGFAVGSRCNTAFNSLCHNYRSPPDSIFVLSRVGTTLLAGAGDICLLRKSALSRRMRPTAQPKVTPRLLAAGAGNASSSRPFFQT
jgi:hypothetical protein